MNMYSMALHTVDDQPKKVHSVLDASYVQYTHTFLYFRNRTGAHHKKSDSYGMVLKQKRGSQHSSTSSGFTIRLLTIGFMRR